MRGFVLRAVTASPDSGARSRFDRAFATRPWLTADYRVADALLDDRTVRLSDVLAGLSYALDLTEGQRPGHSVRSCLIGMRIADVIGLAPDQRSALFYALLMKDLGLLEQRGSIRGALRIARPRSEVKPQAHRLVATRSNRFVSWSRNAAPERTTLRAHLASAGGDVARARGGARSGAHALRAGRGHRAGSSDSREATAEAIRALDEHWDGRGQPYALKGDAIPLSRPHSRTGADGRSVLHRRTASTQPCDMAVARRGTWFDPHLVDALQSIAGGSALLAAISSCHRTCRASRGSSPGSRAAGRRCGARLDRGSVRVGHRREVAVDLPAFQGRRRHRRERSAARARLFVPGAARSAAARAPARPRQARRLESDPGQARQAHRLPSLP